jgi:hypothetical protein
MTLHAEVIDPPSESIELQTGPDARLRISTFENNAGRRFVTVAPQYRDRRTGQWKLAASGLIVSPDACRDLVPALLVMAATIDGAPVDPMPTQQDRDESRMP